MRIPANLLFICLVGISLWTCTRKEPIPLNVDPVDPPHPVFNPLTDTCPSISKRPPKRNPPFNPYKQLLGKYVGTDTIIEVGVEYRDTLIVADTVRIDSLNASYLVFQYEFFSYQNYWPDYHANTDTSKPLKYGFVYSEYGGEATLYYATKQLYLKRDYYPGIGYRLRRGIYNHQ
jgi:hypothetical protein